MVVGVDEARRHHAASRVDDGVRAFVHLTDGFDDSAFDQNAGILNFAAAVVHGDDHIGVFDQRPGHYPVTTL